MGSDRRIGKVRLVIESSVGKIVAARAAMIFLFESDDDVDFGFCAVPPASLLSDRQTIDGTLSLFLRGQNIFNHGIISVVVILHTQNSVNRVYFVNLSSIDPFEAPIQKYTRLLYSR